MVELILLAIKLIVGQPEADATNESQDRHDGIVPLQQGVLRQTNEGLADSRGEGVHEERDGLDQGAHVPGGLGEGVLEGGDRGKDLGDTAQHVGEGLDPDGDGRELLVLVETVVGVLAAVAELVDVVLGDGGGDHGGACAEEPGRDALDRREFEAHSAEARVDEAVHDGDEDDQGEGVEVVDDVVGDAAETHCSWWWFVSECVCWGDGVGTDVPAWEVRLFSIWL